MREGVCEMKIAIGNDHTALELKKTVVALLEDRGISVLDTGTNNELVSLLESLDFLAVDTLRLKDGKEIFGHGIIITVSSS